MPSVKLTDMFVRKLQPPPAGRVEYFDLGKSGLSLRVTARGVKTWTLYDRLESGEKFRHTIGRYPQISLADAHTMAEVAIKHVRKGNDPRKIKAAAAAVEADRQADTIESVAKVFDVEHAAARRWGEFKRVLDVTVIPKWGKRPITDITRRDVRDLIRDVRVRGARGKPAPVQANRTITVLRVFFRWAAKNDYVPADPTSGVDKTPESARTRKFDDNELRAFWRGCDRLGWPFGDCFKLLLMTAARKSEIAEAHWSEINVDDKVMEIPGERTKQKQTHAIPLSASALSVIDGLKRVGEKPNLVFTTNGKTPISGFSKAKAELDGYMLAELHKHDEDAKLEPWRLHDLRRVVRSNLSKLGISSDIAERVLGHAISGVRRHYDAHEYLSEKRGALDRWALHVAGIVNPPPAGKVVKLKGRARR